MLYCCILFKERQGVPGSGSTCSSIVCIGLDIWFVRMMQYIPYLAISALCIVLAWRDGVNYFMHGKPEQHQDKLKIWHPLGAAVYAIGSYGFCHNWYIVAFALLFRYGIFDVIKNKAAGLPVGHIGTTAWWDIQNRKIFKNAIVKAIVSIVAIIILLWIQFEK